MRYIITVNMAKINKSYRLDGKTVSLIEEIAEREGVSATNVVEKSIESYAQISACASDGEMDWKAIYFAEKERNDEMSTKLLELSGKVADSLQASQVIQVMNQTALESAEQKHERKSRWQRLREAWRG